MISKGSIGFRICITKEIEYVKGTKEYEKVMLKNVFLFSQIKNELLQLKKTCPNIKLNFENNSLMSIDFFCSVQCIFLAIKCKEILHNPKGVLKLVLLFLMPHTMAIKARYQMASKSDHYSFYGQF